MCDDCCVVGGFVWVWFDCVVMGIKNCVVLVILLVFVCLCGNELEDREFVMFV